MSRFCSPAKIVYMNKEEGLTTKENQNEKKFAKSIDKLKFKIYNKTEQKFYDF